LTDNSVIASRMLPNGATARYAGGCANRASATDTKFAALRIGFTANAAVSRTTNVTASAHQGTRRCHASADADAAGS
jgi:hypothetical protein